MSPATSRSKRVWRFLLPLGICALLLSVGLWRATASADKAAPKALALHTFDRRTTLNNADLTGNTASFGGAIAGNVTANNCN
jgi:hypothetical protein